MLAGKISRHVEEGQVKSTCNDTPESSSNTSSDGFRKSRESNPALTVPSNLSSRSLAILLAGFTYTRRSVKGADKRAEERGRVVKGAARGRLRTKRRNDEW